MKPRSKRYPLDPLAAAAGIDIGRTGGHQPGDPPDGFAALSNRVHVNDRWIRRIRHRGLTERAADRWACRIGRHPATVWADWCDDLESEEAADGWFSEDPSLDELDDDDDH